MNRKKIIGVQTLVKNEARFIWYSIMSVYSHVDRIRIWDMGSTDSTREIIGKILSLPQSGEKIFYDDTSIVNFNEEIARKRMLTETPKEIDWIIIVDGDEIWWDDSIREVCELIQEKGDYLESIVVPNILPVGDIFHYQESNAGRYRLAGRVGHFALRAINLRIPGLSSSQPHGKWGWVDGEGRMIQDRDPKKIGFIDAPYLHTTFLPRSSSSQHDAAVTKRAKKLKHELGNSFSKDFYYPEVFFRDRPDIVGSPWQVMSPGFKFRAFFETPLRKLKRRIWWGKPGY